MKTLTLVAMAAAGWLGAGSALADPTPATTPTAPATVSPAPTAPPAPAAPAAHSRLDPNEVICKRDDATGTRLGATKVCHTRAEWAERSAAYRDSTDHLEQQTRIVR